MEMWTDIRRDILVNGLSRREACKKYNLNFRTIQKILSYQEPPGYCRKNTRDQPKIGPFLSIIHEILEADKKVHRKQRHTGKRIFERLRDEYGYPGKITVVRDEIRRWKQATAEVFMPLSHPPGEGERTVKCILLGGVGWRVSFPRTWELYHGEIGAVGREGTVLAIGCE